MSPNSSCSLAKNSAAGSTSTSPSPPKPLSNASIICRYENCLCLHKTPKFVYSCPNTRINWLVAMHKTTLAIALTEGTPCSLVRERIWHHSHLCLGFGGFFFGEFQRHRSSALHYMHFTNCLRQHNSLQFYKYIHPFAHCLRYWKGRQLRVGAQREGLYTRSCSSIY